MTGRFTITAHTSADDEHLSAVAEIVQGLTGDPKTLSPRFLYHDEGSRLFDEITRLDEYYPTRVEQSLLERFGAEIVDDVQPSEIVELGPGSGAKSGMLVGPGAAGRNTRPLHPLRHQRVGGPRKRIIAARGVSASRRDCRRRG